MIEFRRIHPLTIVIDLVRTVSRMALVVAFLVFQQMSGRRGDTTELMITAFGLLAIIPPLIRYFTVRFAVVGNNLVIKSGLFVKNDRTIPLDRIQNINLTRNLVHRLLGLVDLEVETAGGRHAEASISALLEKDAERLKAHLLKQTYIEHLSRTSAPPVDVLYQATVGELLLAGATENRIFAILGAVVGADYLGRTVFEDTIEKFAKNATPLIWGSLVVGALLAGWIVSIVMTFIRYYQFELSAQGGKLHRSYGLFSHVENVVPVKRIQVVLIHEGLIHRLLRICKVHAETAGSFSEHPKETGATSLITPILPTSKIDQIVNLLFPFHAPSVDDWHPVGSKTIATHFVSGLWFAVIAAAASVYWLKLKALWLFACLASLMLIRAWLIARSSSYALLEKFLVWRHGYVRRSTAIIPCDKVQSVTLSETPLQRRLGLSTVSVATASHSASGIHQSVFDLPRDIALSLVSELHIRSARSHDTLLDGF